VDSLTPELAARLADMALDASRREYPNHLTHFLNSAADAAIPRKLHPAFYGSLDWHSAVHNHWLLARLIHRFPDARFVARAAMRLKQNLTPEKIAAELAYFQAPGRRGFERPYGWGWLVRLELALDDLPEQRTALQPLVALVGQRIEPWLMQLPYAVRSGEHTNTALSLGWLLDWARARGQTAITAAIRSAALRFYVPDHAASLAWEPSGHDFISPALAEADLMRRVLPPVEFLPWLQAFLPDLPRDGKRAFSPVVMPESVDYKLAHLTGLNLSRAWMLAALAAATTAERRLCRTLAATAWEHRRAGLAAALRPDYAASHWLPTFALDCLEHPSWRHIPVPQPHDESVRP